MVGSLEPFIHTPQKRNGINVTEKDKCARSHRVGVTRAGRDAHACFPRVQGPEDGRNDGMPQTKTISRARAAKREGKSASTQAGEFVREEVETIRKGVHGARSAKQAIAIGLSKARRAGCLLYTS